MRASMFAAILMLASVLPAAADPPAPPVGAFGAQEGSSFSPLVPVSAFARPAGWLDMSRMRVSTSVSVGTGFGGRTEALQVSTLSYQLAAPLAVRLSIGNTFGTGSFRSGNGMFLEGFAVAYRPHPSFQINVDYRDVRSLLQLSQSSQYPFSSGYGAFGR